MIIFELREEEAKENGKNKLSLEVLMVENKFEEFSGNFSSLNICRENRKESWRQESLRINFRLNFMLGFDAIRRWTLKQLYGAFYR